MRLKEQADERKMEGVNNKRMPKEWNVLNMIKYQKEECSEWVNK